jgi:hypothetical protein
MMDRIFLRVGVRRWVMEVADSGVFAFHGSGAGAEQRSFGRRIVGEVSCAWVSGRRR